VRGEGAKSCQAKRSRRRSTCSGRIMTFLRTNERMNERRPHIAHARARGKVGDQMVERVSRIAKLLDENAIGCKVKPLIPCQEGGDASHHFSGVVIRLGRFRGGFANGTQRRQFARHVDLSVSTCLGGLKAPPTLPFGLELLDALHSCTNRCMNHRN